MSTAHAQLAKIVAVKPLGPGLVTAKTATLARAGKLEVIRLVVPAGKKFPTHRAPGPITLQCLEGHVSFTAQGSTRPLSAGQLICLAEGEPHSLEAIDDASLLLTIVRCDGPALQPHDSVQEASEESFPASDPPSHTPITGP